MKRVSRNYVVAMLAACLFSFGLFTPAQVHGQAKIAAGLDAVDKAVDLGLKIHGILGSVNRKGLIHIVNGSAYQLSSPKTHTFSGNIVNLNEARKIDALDANVVAVRKSEQGYAGAVGVITYKIEGTRSRLAICYSIPYDYGSYENWFKYSIIGENTAVNKDLYEDMYYNYGKLTSGKIAKASSGENTWTSGEFTMSGTMDTNGDCKMWVYLDSKTKAQPKPQPRRVVSLPAKSTTNGAAIKVSFTNNLNTPVSAVWVDFNGKEVAYSTIQPRGNYTIDSYPGHVWKFKSNGSVVSGHVVAANTTNYSIR